MAIQDGSRVRFHYSLKVDGEEVDSSAGKDPLAYVHGRGQIIPGLEEHLAGMEVGEQKEISIPPEKAYGPRDPEAVREVPKAAFEDPDGLEVGDRVGGRAGGHPFQATIVAVGEENVTLDMNHPLAEKQLDFSVEVVSIE